jgi:hypothetical protein
VLPTIIRKVVTYVVARRWGGWQTTALSAKTCIHESEGPLLRTLASFRAIHTVNGITDDYNIPKQKVLSQFTSPKGVQHDRFVYSFLLGLECPLTKRCFLISVSQAPGLATSRHTKIRRDTCESIPVPGQS